MLRCDGHASPIQRDEPPIIQRVWISAKKCLDDGLDDGLGGGGFVGVGELWRVWFDEESDGERAIVDVGCGRSRRFADRLPGAGRAEGVLRNEVFGEHAGPAVSSQPKGVGIHQRRVHHQFVTATDGDGRFAVARQGRRCGFRGGSEDWRRRVRQHGSCLWYSSQRASEQRGDVHLGNPCSHYPGDFLRPQKHSTRGSQSGRVRLRPPHAFAGVAVRRRAGGERRA